MSLSMSYRRKEMAMVQQAQAVKGKAVLADFLELGANAFAGGLIVAIALAVITLALATTAQAAPIEQAAVMQTTCTGDMPDEPRSAASTPAVEDAAGVGALWANLLLATVALSSAGIVAVIGRTVPARRRMPPSV